MTADATVASPRAPATDRVLIRLGVRDDIARIVAATPSLRASWLLAAFGAALFAVWGDDVDPDMLAVVLVLAPVLPVVGVAAAYGPWVDPMFEIAQATPASGLRVLLLRSVAVLLAAAALVVVAAPTVPGAGFAAVAWVLPALALCSSSLMLATFLPLPRAAALVTAGWLALAAAVDGATGAASTLYGGSAQLAFFAITVGSSLVLARRRHHLEVTSLRGRLALVDAADAERRRIERNIHDGAQQQLVAIGVKAGLARSFVTKDPDRAIAIIDELGAEVLEALDGLRDMTRGAYPPILADRGLEAAISLRAKRSPMTVTVEAADLERLPTRVEIAVYFCCLEALQNAAKYAGAAAATVTIRRTGDDLAFSIHDEGVGFDPAAVQRGVGMRSMAERVESLGGSLDVHSSPGNGTMIVGRVPISALDDRAHRDDRPTSSLRA